MNKKLIAYIFLLILLSVLLVFQVIRMTNQYSIWKGNYEYMESENKTIQPWMTLNLINKYFDKDYEFLFEILNLTDTSDNRKITLEEYCRDKEVDCEEIIKKIKND